MPCICLLFCKSHLTFTYPLLRPEGKQGGDRRHSHMFVEGLSEVLEMGIVRAGQNFKGYSIHISGFTDEG